MGNRIMRDYTKYDLAIDTVLADCTEIPIAAFAGMSLMVPVGATVVTLTVYGTHERGGTFLPLMDADNGSVVMTVAGGKIQDVPTAVFSCLSVKFVGNADEPSATAFCKG